MITSICIYGYSFTVLLPLLFLCVIPFEIARYIALGYGLIASTSFLLYNMYKAIENRSGSSKYIVLGLILGCQVLLYMILKFYFFSQININDFIEHAKMQKEIQK